VKLLREPLLHFVVIGALVYLLYGLFAESAVEPDDKTIIVSAGEIKWMRNSWEKRWNRPPTAAEFDGLIKQYVREMVLYREALTMGLNQHDMVIRRRLAQKLEFLTKDLVALTPPSEAELQEYFEVNEDRYREPARYTFTQIFFDPDKRGDSTLADAAAIKAQLVAQTDPLSNAEDFGDGLMLQNYYPEKDPLEIRKTFGGGFTESLLELSPGQWHGPILSGFGVHLVYLSHVTAAPAPVFDELRERVAADWKLDKGEELNEKFYANLRESYTVVIEAPGEGPAGQAQESSQ